MVLKVLGPPVSRNEIEKFLTHILKKSIVRGWRGGGAEEAKHRIVSIFDSLRIGEEN